MRRLRGERVRRPVCMTIDALALVLVISISYSVAVHAAAPVRQNANPAAVGVNGATLYDVPDGEAITELSIATVLDPSGRSEDGAWLFVETRDGESVVFSRSAGSWTCDDIGYGLCIVLPSCPDDDDLPFPFDCPIDNIDSTEKNVPQFALARVNASCDNYRDLNVLNTALAPDWNEAGIVYDSSTTIETTKDEPGAETQQVYAESWTDDADWQPGGGLIAYQARQGSHWEIFVIQPEDSSPFALTRPETTLVDQLPSNVAPAWSPDGNYIAFLSNREENNEADAWVMNADGSNQRPLPIEYGYGHTQRVSWGR